MWDPTQYRRFAGERDRPFFDLLARVDAPDARAIADLGCGTGDQTRALAERWPGASVVGVDSSAEMLAKAAPHALPGRLSFVQADLRGFAPAAPLDVIVSNATLHWVPDHRALVPRLCALLAPGGTLAVQVPANHTEPSHALLAQVAARPRWVARAAPAVHRSSVEEPRVYLELLQELGLAVDLWQTTYFHVLPGDDAVLEWLRGTTLRPVIAALGDDAPAFLADLSHALAPAYPRGPSGTVFPFRRLFFVARRPA